MTDEEWEEHLRTSDSLTWDHEVHTDDCMSIDGERGRARMTRDTIAANHRLHVGDVERAAARQVSS